MIKSNEMRHNHTAFVNGAARKCFVGKNNMYILCNIAPGCAKWFTKAELEKLGCVVKIRSGRN